MAAPELVEEGARALVALRPPRRMVGRQMIGGRWQDAGSDLAAAAVIDAVEPLIRAAERERKMAAADIAFLDAVQTRQALVDLRAKVERWRDIELEATDNSGDYFPVRAAGAAAAYNAVLKLIDEAQHG